MAKMIIGILGGVCGSWSIGVFFMMPYLAPAQISSVEEKLTGRNHSAMYFAGNALATSIVGAISGNLVYEYIKNVFFSKEHGFVWATSSNEAYELLYGAAATDEVVATSIFNFGNLLVPFIVSITCILGVILAFKLPKDFTPTILAEEYKKLDPNVDVSIIEKEETPKDRTEVIFVQVGLSVLSGFIFAFIWTGMLINALKEFKSKFKTFVPFLLSCFVPFAAIYFNLKFRQIIIDEAEKCGANVKINKIVLIITSIIFPILPLNIVSLALLQNGINKLYVAKDN